MAISPGLKLEKSQKQYSPEILEANALDAGSITAAMPWLVRLNYYADETGNKFWKKRVKDIYADYGFDLGSVVSSVGGPDKLLGERTPPEDFENNNVIFVTKVYNKDLNLKRLWNWTLDHFVDNISHKYEWLAGLLFFGNQQLLRKELNGGKTPTTVYAKQMRDWFGQVCELDCSDDQINDYRNGFILNPTFSYTSFVNDLTYVPKKKNMVGDQTPKGFSNIKALCKKLENNFDLNLFL